MRLIDADELIEQGWHLERCGPSNVLVGIKSIADVPTACSVEAVVKELEELKENAVKKVTPKNVLAHIDFVEGIDKAIEIVKGGVK